MKVSLILLQILLNGFPMQSEFLANLGIRVHYAKMGFKRESSLHALLDYILHKHSENYPLQGSGSSVHRCIISYSQPFFGPDSANLHDLHRTPDFGSFIADLLSISSIQVHIWEAKRLLIDPWGPHGGWTSVKAITHARAILSATELISQVILQVKAYRLAHRSTSECFAFTSSDNRFSLWYFPPLQSGIDVRATAGWEWHDSRWGALRVLYFNESMLLYDLNDFTRVTNLSTKLRCALYVICHGLPPFNRSLGIGERKRKTSWFDVPDGTQLEFEVHELLLLPNKH